MTNIEQTSTKGRHINEYNFLDLFRDLRRGVPRPKKDKSVIVGIHAVPKTANVCKIYSDGEHVYANTRFFKNDIIEICPVRAVSRSAVFDYDMKQIIFEVEKDNVYVIPFGYCQFYDVKDENNNPNCDYIWDPNRRVIVITALSDIVPGSKLILNI